VRGEYAWFVASRQSASAHAQRYPVRVSRLFRARVRAEAVCSAGIPVSVTEKRHKLKPVSPQQAAMVAGPLKR